MAQVLLVVGVIVVAWFVIGVVVALFLGRAVRLADDRQKAHITRGGVPVHRVPTRPGVRPVQVRAS